METERIEWNEVNKAMKKRAVQIKVNKAKEFAFGLLKAAWEHKEAIAATAVATVGVVAEGRRVYDRIDAKLENRRKQREIYDPSMHRTIKLNKKLTPSQERQISEMRAEGFTYHEIYHIMGLI